MDDSCGSSRSLLIYSAAFDCLPQMIKKAHESGCSNVWKPPLRCGGSVHKMMPLVGIAQRNRAASLSKLLTKIAGCHVHYDQRDHSAGEGGFPANAVNAGMQ